MNKQTTTQNFFSADTFKALGTSTLIGLVAAATIFHVGSNGFGISNGILAAVTVVAAAALALVLCYGELGEAQDLDMLGKVQHIVAAYTFLYISALAGFMTLVY